MDPIAANDVSSLNGDTPVVTATRSVIAGYRLLERLGSGGYGEVWKAEAPGGLPKAIKIVHGNYGDKCANEEGKALARIKEVRHPFLLSLERIEVVDNQLMIVSELADGSLQDRYDTCRASGQPGIPHDELLRYIAEAADALDYLTQEHGLQHLDIKPENLLLVSGHVKVGDFGLVKSVRGASVSVVSGLTPMFAAPETFDGQPSDCSDQYSLAIVYQTMLTGIPPIAGNSMAHLANQHLNARPNVASLPEADRAIVERALSKSPFDRFPNCRAFAERLQGTNRAAQVAAPRKPQPTNLPASESAEPNQNQTVIVDVPEFSADLSSETKDLAGIECSRIVDLEPLATPDTASLQPTLFIGIGGIGEAVLRRLGEHWAEQRPELASSAALKFLVIDTDGESFEPIVNEEQKVVHEWAAGQTVNIPLRTAKEYRKQIDNYTHWLSRRWFFNIPKTLETDGIRPLGRLALVDHIARVQQRIDDQVEDLLSSAATMPHDISDELVVDSTRPRVIIVGSLSGGTSSGVVWDVAQIVHQALVHHDATHTDLIHVLAHWTPPGAKERELATVNACASLRELHHYLNEGCPGDPACQLPPLGRHYNLFQNVYLANYAMRSRDVPVEDVVDELAHYLNHNTATTTAEFANQCRESDKKSSDRNNLRTFRILEINDDHFEAAEQVSRRLVSHAIWSLVNPVAGNAKLAAMGKQAAHDEFRETIDIAEAISHDSHLNFDALLRNVQETIANHVQKDCERWFPKDVSVKQRVSIAATAPLVSQIDELLPAAPSFSLAGNTLDDKFRQFVETQANHITQCLATLIDNPELRFPAAHSAAEFLIGELQKSKENASKMSGGLEAELRQLPSALFDEEGLSNSDRIRNTSKVGVLLSDLQHYFALRQLQNTFGWTWQLANHLQGEVRETVQKLTKFQNTLTSLSASLGNKSSQANLSADGSEQSHPLKVSWQANQLDKINQEIAKSLENDVAENYGGLASLMSEPAEQLQQIVQQAVTLARARAIECILQGQLESLEPNLLECGGARRYFISASKEFQDSGLLDRIRDKLPAPPTVVYHDQPEITLLCEVEGLSAQNVAQHIAEYRPELLDLASRLPTRVDVSWSPF